MGNNNLLTNLWLFPALVCAAGSVLVWQIEFKDPDPIGDWHDASQRVESRLRPGEMVMFFRTAHAHNARALEGMPLACDTGARGKEFTTVKPAGIWILGNRTLSRKLRALKRKYSNGGSAAYGTVFIHHMWNQRPPESRKPSAKKQPSRKRKPGGGKKKK